VSSVWCCFLTVYTHVCVCVCACEYVLYTHAGVFACIPIFDKKGPALSKRFFSNWVPQVCVYVCMCVCVCVCFFCVSMYVCMCVWLLWSIDLILAATMLIITIAVNHMIIIIIIIQFLERLFLVLSTLGKGQHSDVLGSNFDVRALYISMAFILINYYSYDYYYYYFCVIIIVSMLNYFHYCYYFLGICLH